MPEIMDKNILKALSTETRQEIIKLLAKRPYTASELSGLLKKHVTTVTEHLDMLESSGLIRKKESSNKWVYYALTDKGEKIFKPAYYSWVVVLSISVLCLLIGAQQIFMSPVMFSTAGAAEMVQSDRATVPLLGDAGNATDEPASKANIEAVETVDARLIIGTFLLVTALAGFSFVILKKARR